VIRLEAVARKIIEAYKASPSMGSSGLVRLKYKASSEAGLGRVPRNHEIIKYLRQGEEWLVPMLRGKGVRSASGIYTIAVMTKPSPCPKDKPCSYCPGGPKADTPQSYLGNEPALMRGVQTGFDPYLQVRYRLDQYTTIGHSPSKVQLIIMGGTFPATDLDYQEWFVCRCLQAMNDYPHHKNHVAWSLEDAQRRNGSSRVRCIGITMETRPDWACRAQIDRMLGLGATLVELGVQALDDGILAGVNRGHSTADVVEATRALRDSGLKVGYHMMPGLPGSHPSRDLGDLKRIFEDADFRPDYLKIYPTLVIGGTALHSLWREGKYRALSTEEAVELIGEAHRFFPKWVRVARIQRDVPAGIIADGVKRSNLREIVDAWLDEKGIRCRCIRCREVGLSAMRSGRAGQYEGSLARETYGAGEGTEEFLSFEDRKSDLLIGFLRLRIPSVKAHRREIKGAGVVRELHIYGQQVAVGERGGPGFQHRGFGARLLEEAERIVRDEHGLKRIAVLPGVGVRGYYRARGYRKVPSSPFMVKALQP
jgi:elongator complex protein 3